MHLTTDNNAYNSMTRGYYTSRQSLVDVLFAFFSTPGEGALEFEVEENSWEDVFLTELASFHEAALTLYGRSRFQLLAFLNNFVEGEPNLRGVN